MTEISNLPAPEVKVPQAIESPVQEQGLSGKAKEWRVAVAQRVKGFVRNGPASVDQSLLALSQMPDQAPATAETTQAQSDTPPNPTAENSGESDAEVIRLKKDVGFLVLTQKMSEAMGGFAGAHKEKAAAIMLLGLQVAARKFEIDHLPQMAQFANLALSGIMGAVGGETTRDKITGAVTGVAAGMLVSEGMGHVMDATALSADNASVASNLAEDFPKVQHAVQKAVQVGVTTGVKVASHVAQAR